MKRLPHNEVVEGGVLGAVLLAGSLGDASSLEVADFFLPAHQALWSTMRKLALAGTSLDVVAVHEAMRAEAHDDHELGARYDPLKLVGGLVGLHRVADQGVGVRGIVGRHAVTLRELRQQRDVIAAAQEVVERGLDEASDFSVDWAEATLFRATSRVAGRRVVGPKGAAKSFWDRLVKRSKGEVRCVATPWPELNDLLGGGLQPGNLVVVGGRPSMGKTALALQIAAHASTPRPRDLAGQQLLRPVDPALVFSLEMSADELVDRVMAGESGVTGDRLRRASLVADESQALLRASERLVLGALHIEDSSSPTVLDIAAGARRFRADRELFGAGQVGVIVVDYIGLVPPVAGGPRGRNREQEVAEVSKALKALARDLQMPVVVVAQLNRLAEGRSSKRPMLSDLRESGAIEQDADVVLLMYREEYYLDPNADEAERARVAGLAECIVAKQRNGPTDTVRLRFNKQLARFDTLERRTP